MTRQERKRNTASTYAGFAESEASEPRGRFGAISKAKVAGSSELVEYPELPQNSPWHHDPVPDEPPISFLDMSAPEPVGTHQEIAASLGDAHSDDVGQLHPPVVVSALPGEAGAAAGAPSGDDEQLASPPSRKRRRKP